MDSAKDTPINRWAHFLIRKLIYCAPSSSSSLLDSTATDKLLSHHQLLSQLSPITSICRRTEHVLSPRTSMDTFRPQKSPGSDRFLGLLSSSPPSTSSSLFEFDEQDIFSTDTAPSPIPNPRSPSLPSPLNSNPSTSPLSPFHRDRNFGILAALPEEFSPQEPKFLQRKPSISSSASISPSSSSSSARMIPVIPKPKATEYGPKMGYPQFQSAPVNVPVVPGRRVPPVEREEVVGDEGDEDDDEMVLPPHEIVDRAHGNGEPLTTFSVLEGVGRTLKGRDLRRVRNAVWHKTGFLD